MSYSCAPPLDELLTSWRESLTEQRQLHSNRIAAHVASVLADTRPLSHQAAIGWLQEKVCQEVWPLTTEEMLPACLAWLGDKVESSREITTDDLKPEISECRCAVPVPTLCPASSPLTYNPYSWVLPAVFGGLIGALLFGWNWSFITSVLFVAGMAWLLGRPAARSSLGAAGGQHEQAESAKSSLPFFVAASVDRLQAWIVRLVIRPSVTSVRPSFGVSQLRQLVDDYYNACADLILIVCWARVTGQGVALAQEAADDKVPDSLFDAIGVLQRSMEAAADDPQALQDAAQELVQAFVNEGYVWQSVQRGTPFEQRMLTHFKTYGNIEVGQSVKMLKSALCKQGSVLIRGTIKRL